MGGGYNGKWLKTTQYVFHVSNLTGDPNRHHMTQIISDPENAAGASKVSK